MTTFWEATERVRQGLPIINKEHEAGYRFLFSLSQNEVFEYLEGTDRPVQERLYRVQKMSLNKFGDLNIWFRQQYETELDDSLNSKLLMKYINTRTVKHLREFNKSKSKYYGQDYLKMLKRTLYFYQPCLPEFQIETAGGEFSGRNGESPALFHWKIWVCWCWKTETLRSPTPFG